MNEPKVLIGDEKERFLAELKERRRWYSTGRKSWSFAHHSALYLSIVLAAAAAVIPQTQGLFSEQNQGNITSIVAGLGALLLSIGTGGNFSRKWRANRLSNGKIEQIFVELIGREPTGNDLQRLNEIDANHDKALFGE